MASNGSLRPQRPPHITVNSGSGGNLLDSIRSDSSHSSRPDTPGTPGMSRQLLPAQRSASGGSSRIAGPPIYGSPNVGASTEMLLPPSRTRVPRPYQDDPHSRSGSAMSSRRTSWSSDAGSRDSRYGPFASPFDDSRAPSRAGSDDDNINTQTVSEKYNIMPSAGLLLFPEDVEKDDYLHNPDPNDKDQEKCDVFSKRGMMNVGGLAFITIGLLVLFIGYPVLYDLPPCFVSKADSRKEHLYEVSPRQLAHPVQTTPIVFQTSCLCLKTKGLDLSILIHRNLRTARHLMMEPL
jgi:beta-glucan synthesis-associated protein KRE6